MARFSLKIGDVFSVNLGNGYKKFFQYVCDDLTQMNSEVIRVFNRNYALEADPEVDAVVSDDIDFYAHVVCKIGVKLDLWCKVGNSKDVGTQEIYFRQSADYGYVGAEYSKKWQVWMVGEEMNFVGKLPAKYHNLDIGAIITPYDIIEKLKTGRYGFVYPSYVSENY